MPKDVTSALVDGVGTSDPAMRYQLECALCMFTGGGFITPCRFTEKISTHLFCHFLHFWQFLPLYLHIIHLFSIFLQLFFIFSIRILISVSYCVPEPPTFLLLIKEPIRTNFIVTRKRSLRF